MTRDNGRGRAGVAAPNGPRPSLPSFQPIQLQRLPPCQGACPNATDIRGWIGTIAQRRKTGLSLEEAYARAWAMITQVNPLPATLGRICPHPCEAHCNRAAGDGSVSINAMERFLGDWALRKRLRFSPMEDDWKPEWIGVIGAGPSGLSFAYQMACRRYPVTVYERRKRPGGMLRYGIPDYRLPPAVLDAEIERMVELGIDLRLEAEVGRDLTVDELKRRHAALYVGIGAQKGRGLGLQGEEGLGIWPGTAYLERIKEGEGVALGAAVAVIGGGNTAVDAARTARRAGAEVTILYRRSRAEMPASPSEVEEALEEGVRIDFLTAPVELRSQGGRLCALVAQSMELGAPDGSGRRSPVPILGSVFELPVDSVIAAVSQEPDWATLDGLRPEGLWLATDGWGEVADRLWAGGDVVGAGIAATAVFQGRKAAEALHARLRRLPLPPEDRRPSVGPERIDYDFHPRLPPTRPGRLEPSEALAHPTAEVSLGITERELLQEAERCLSCGSCFGCQQCWMYCSSQCFTPSQESRPGVYFTLSLDECRACGKCIDLCPCGYLTASPSPA